MELVLLAPLLLTLTLTSFFDSAASLKCYQCVNCIFARDRTLVTCPGTDSIACGSIKFKWVEWQTSLLCSAACNPQSVSTFEVSCCTTDGCNTASNFQPKFFVLVLTQTLFPAIVLLIKLK